jgi:ABC-type transporter Mla subunit MlaD
MALQDLTPRLRTRLSRLEWTVGLFVALATLLLLTGFALYFRNTAEKRGWFKTKVTYFTFVSSAAGLKVGDPVKLMGFEAGNITAIRAQPPEDAWFNVYVEFEVMEPHFGYLWTTGSVAKVAADGFLGSRYIEVTKGTGGKATYQEKQVTNWFFGQRVKTVATAVWDPKAEGGKGAYVPRKLDSKYWLPVEEAPAINDRLEKLAQQVENALPNILGLTNQLASTLNSSAAAMSNANNIIVDIRPVASNIVFITENLKNPKGSLGEWVIPTNISSQLELTIGSANQTLTNASIAIKQLDKTLATADTTVGSVNQVVTNANDHVALLVSNLNVSLTHLASITSNLNSQVQANTNIVSEISSAIVSADEMLQGLKRHWLLRSAFKEPKKKDEPKSAPGTNAPIQAPLIPKVRQQQGVR